MFLIIGQGLCSFKIKIWVSKYEKKHSRGSLEQILPNSVKESHLLSFRSFMSRRTDLTNLVKENFLTNLLQHILTILLFFFANFEFLSKIFFPFPLYFDCLTSWLNSYMIMCWFGYLFKIFIQNLTSSKEGNYLRLNDFFI